MAAGGFDENGEVLLPDCVRVALRPLIGQIDALDEAIGAIDKEIAASVDLRRALRQRQCWRFILRHALMIAASAKAAIRAAIE